MAAVGIKTDYGSWFMPTVTVSVFRRWQIWQEDRGSGLHAGYNLPQYVSIAGIQGLDVYAGEYRRGEWSPLQ